MASYITRQAAARALIRAGMADNYADAASMLPPDPSAACNMISADLIILQDGHRP